MKRRLRKKKHLGEFKIYGVSLEIKRNTEDDFDNFLDSFVLEAIEANNFYFCGYGKEKELEGFIELGLEANHPDQGVEKITNWLASRNDVESFSFGQITDAYYGPFDK